MRRIISRIGTVLVLSFSVLGVSATTACKKEPAAEAGFKVGDTVDVEWKGSWWKGKVLSKTGEKYKVHYVGWAASWDEEVPAARVRAATPDAKVGTAKE